MNTLTVPECAWQAKNHKDFLRQQEASPQITSDTALRHSMSLGAIAKLTMGELKQSDEIEIIQVEFLTELKVADRDYLLEQALLSVIKECAAMPIAQYKVEAEKHIAYYNKCFIGEFYCQMGLNMKESIRIIAQYFFHKNILLAL